MCFCLNPVISGWCMQCKLDTLTRLVQSLVKESAPAAELPEGMILPLCTVSGGHGPGKSIDNQLCSESNTGNIKVFHFY